MTDRQADIEAKAQQIIASWRDYSDPEAEMARLEKQAGADMEGFFFMMYEGLAVAMNEGQA